MIRNKQALLIRLRLDPNLRLSKNEGIRFNFWWQLDNEGANSLSRVHASAAEALLRGGYLQLSTQHSTWRKAVYVLKESK